MKRLVPVLAGTLAVSAATLITGLTGVSVKAGAAPVAPTFAKDVAPIVYNK